LTEQNKPESLNYNIDIIISFNEIKYEKYLGFGKKSIPYTRQIGALINSLRQNWREFRGNIYCLYSKLIDWENVCYLENKGAIVERVTGIEPNRDCCYLLGNQAEYSLILDADILFLKPPQLEFTKDVYMQRAILPGISGKDWEFLIKAFNLIQENSSGQSQNNPSGNNQKLPHYNNGVILIRTSYKKEFYNIMQHAKRFILEKLSGKEIRHYVEQIATSIAFELSENRDLLHPGVNFLGNHAPLNSKVSVFHYLGEERGLKDWMKKDYFD
jgi:hypothetical protein